MPYVDGAGLEVEERERVVMVVHLAEELREPRLVDLRLCLVVAHAAHVAARRISTQLVLHRDGGALIDEAGAARAAGTSARLGLCPSRSTP